MYSKILWILMKINENFVVGTWQYKIIINLYRKCMEFMIRYLRIPWRIAAPLFTLQSTCTIPSYVYQVLNSRQSLRLVVSAEKLEEMSTLIYATGQIPFIIIHLNCNYIYRVFILKWTSIYFRNEGLKGKIWHTKFIPHRGGNFVSKHNFIQHVPFSKYSN